MRDKNKIIEYWKELSKKYYIDDCSIYIEELRKSSFIPFIGAGMSVSFKYPTWNGFLKKRIDEIPASDLDEKKKKKRILKKSLKDGNYLEVAEEIDNDLNHGLNEHVRRSFGNKEIPGDAVNYIAHLADFDIKTYVTTNYDPVIETLFSDARNGEKLEIYLPNRLRDTDEIQNAIRDGHECLIKLHGTYDNSSSIVLTKTQYDKYYSDESNIIDTLYSLLPRSPLLFMGCSLSKDYLYDAIEKKARTSDYWNYAILTQPQSSKALINKCNHELVKLKIRPIWFPMNEYDSIITILELLTMKNPYVVHDTKDPLEKFGKNYSEEYQVFVDSNAVEALSDINERNGEHRAELLFSAIMGFNNRCGSSLPKSLEDFTTTINSTQSRNALLIEGAPGIGKSTMLSLLYLVYRKKYPNIYNCYIDLHLYSQESKRDALRPISEYLESIESKLNLFDGVVLFLDGVNEYKRTDSITEKAVSDWIKKHKTSNIKYCLAKGTIDPDEKADFYQSDLSEGFPKNDFELRIKLVKKSTSSINPIIKNLLEFFGIYNRSIDEVEEYLRSVNLSYDKDASETQKRDQFINSITDRFEMYCKRVAPRFIDLSTMNLLASFVRQHDYSAFDEPISNPFYVRYLQSEPRGSRLTKAKIITHYLLGKADISEEYRNEMYKNSIVRDFYVAYYFQGMLRKGNVQEIEELNLIFTNVVNRFIVSLMTRLQREEQLALDTMRNFFDKVNSRTRNQFAYLMGRMSRRDTVEAAQIFLKHVFKKMIKQYEHEKFDIDSLMLFRTIGVSLIYLNDSECEDDFYKILIYDRNMRTLNRNFHIEYFVAKDYKVHGGDLLKESVYEKEGILKLWNFLYHSVFVRQEREPMGLSVITMADLIIYREYIYSKEQNDELKILNFQEFYKNIKEKQIRLNPVLEKYLANAQNLLHGTADFATAMTAMYYIKETIRSGWVNEERAVNVNHPAESVADHSWACCILAELFLTKDINDSSLFADIDKEKYKDSYNKEHIIRLLLVHDLAELETGDIPTTEMTDEDIKEQKLCMEEMSVLGSIPIFQELYSISQNWYEFSKEINEHTDVNVKIAYEIDKLEPLIQLLMYRKEFPVDRYIKIRDDWISSVRAEFERHEATSFGYNLFDWILKYIIDDEHYLYNISGPNEEVY